MEACVGVYRPPAVPPLTFECYACGAQFRTTKALIAHLQRGQGNCPLAAKAE